MRYCPICWTERRIRHIKGSVQYWWKYKVKKEPEPDYYEAVLKMIPMTIGATLCMEIANKLTEDAIEEHRKSKLKVKT